MHGLGHRWQVHDACFFRRGLHDRHAGPAEHPASYFTRVHKQPVVAVLDYAGTVGVREDNDVHFAKAVTQIVELVGHRDSRTVFCPVAHWRMSQGADDLHATGDANLVAIVVTKARDDGARDLAHGGHDQRRNKVTRQQDQVAAFGIE